MRPSAFTVLSFLEDSQMALPPKVVCWNMKEQGIEIGYSTVRKTLPELEEYGLVNRAAEEEGYYRITDRGRKFLAGEIDADDL